MLYAELVDAALQGRGCRAGSNINSERAAVRLLIMGQPASRARKLVHSCTSFIDMHDVHAYKKYASIIRYASHDDVGYAKTRDLGIVQKYHVGPEMEILKVIMGSAEFRPDVTMYAGLIVLCHDVPIVVFINDRNISPDTQQKWIQVDVTDIRVAVLDDLDLVLRENKSPETPVYNSNIRTFVIAAIATLFTIYMCKM